VPKRSNFFQDVVALVQRHSADDAIVEDSGSLVDSSTGEEREVDVVIRREVAGYEVTISVEAIDRSRRASVEWVEQMLGKHESLPTDKLVLVSNRGFSGSARQKAEKAGAVAIEPRDIASPDDANRTGGKLDEVWPKNVSFTVDQVSLRTSTPAGQEPLEDFTPGMAICAADGTQLGTLTDLVTGSASAALDKEFETLARDVTTEEARRLTVHVEPVEVGEARISVYVRTATPPPLLYHIEALDLGVNAVIRSHGAVSLEHKNFGDVPTSFGEVTTSERRGALVITERPGDHRATIRLRESPSSDAIDIEMKSVAAPRDGAQDR
jgi:hypothetical protein